MEYIAYLQFMANGSIEAKNYAIVESCIHTARSHNSFHPDSLPACKSIDLTITAPEGDDMELQQWFFNNDYRTGRLVFNIEHTSFHVFCFEDAQCYAIEEKYMIESTKRLLSVKFVAANFGAFEAVNLKYDGYKELIFEEEEQGEEEQGEEE